MEEVNFNHIVSQFIPVAMVHRARLCSTEVFRVTLTAVLLTARGLGTPGVRARDAACRNKPERCVLHETRAVEEQCVLLFEAKRKTATLACKSHIYCLLAFPRMFYLNSARHSFLQRSVSHFVLVGGSFLHSLLFFLWSKISRVDNNELLSTPATRRYGEGRLKSLLSEWDLRLTNLAT